MENHLSVVPKFKWSHCSSTCLCVIWEFSALRSLCPVPARSPFSILQANCTFLLLMLLIWDSNNDSGYLSLPQCGTGGNFKFPDVSLWSSYTAQGWRVHKSNQQLFPLLPWYKNVLRAVSLQSADSTSSTAKWLCIPCFGHAFVFSSFLFDWSIQKRKSSSSVQMMVRICVRQSSPTGKNTHLEMKQSHLPELME